MRLNSSEFKINDIWSRLNYICLSPIKICFQNLSDFETYNIRRESARVKIIIFSFSSHRRSSLRFLYYLSDCRFFPRIFPIRNLGDKNTLWLVRVGGKVFKIFEIRVNSRKRVDRKHKPPRKMTFKQDFLE